MKKMIATALLVCLALLSLTSCIPEYTEGAWFDRSHLAEAKVPCLPAPSDKPILRVNDMAGPDVLVELSDAELNAYAETVYNYLLERDFEYLGTRGEQKNTLAGIFTTYYFRPATELSEFFRDGNWRFVYSDGTRDENGDVRFCIITIQDCDSSVITRNDPFTKSFAFNAKICVRVNSESAINGMYVLEDDHSHTFEYEGTEQGHQKLYTCGCAYPDMLELHSDDDGNKRCDLCDFALPDS